MKKIAGLLLLHLAVLCATAQQPAVLKIRVDPTKTIHTITPEYWGTNFLYWIDDDSSLKDGSIAQTLKDAHIRVLRYPGGTVADNFHWKTATLENTNMFPFESGAAETDFDEFMTQCRKIGAEPSLVVNTETWAVNKDIAGGAHEAAQWVRYCKQKGYQVRFWELGNETYWHPVLSASEYGDLVNQYADSMKKVDPSIILGVNGHWNINFVGTKERIRPEDLKMILNHREHITSPAESEAYHDLVKSKTRMPVTNGDQKWWKILAEKTGSKVDMIIVHWYFNPKQLDEVKDRLLELRALFKQMYPQKQFLLYMSEYNVNEKAPTSFQDLTEMQGQMLQAGTDLMALWPMRMKYRKPTIIDYASGKRSMQYEIFKKLSEDLTGHIVEVKADKGLYAYASADGDHRTVVISGKALPNDAAIEISFAGAAMKGKNCRIWRIGGTEFNYHVEQSEATLDNNRINLHVLPTEVVVVSY